MGSAREQLGVSRARSAPLRAVWGDPSAGSSGGCTLEQRGIGAGLAVPEPPTKYAAGATDGTYPPPLV
eukprot:gene20104-biopygen2547